MASVDVHDAATRLSDLEITKVRLWVQLKATGKSSDEQLYKDLSASLDALCKQLMSFGPALEDEFIKTNMGNVTFRADLRTLTNDGSSLIVALKASRLNNLSLESPIREAAVLQVVNVDRHPSIVKFVRAHRVSQTFYCATEFVETGDLLAFITCSVKKMSIFDMMRKFLSICYAMDYMHNGLFIAHLDLKPDNILSTPESGVKLVDFGVARVVEPVPAAESPKNATLPGFTELMRRVEDGKRATEGAALQDGNVLTAALRKYPALPVPAEALEQLPVE